MSLTAGDQLGPYRIVTLLGKGGMGEVYRATDTRLNREVALKIAAEAFDERFAREARAIASLNHPNICTLYDVGPNYLVMELVEGASPAGPLPLDETLHIANQIADALEAAHEKGIVHRDLKPGNILVKPDGTVKVLDFGLAKMHVRAQASGEDSPTMSMAATQAGVILGTAAYMAPEQAKGKAVDARADIWAFGVVLYELTTGRRLFQGDDVTEILASVVRDQPDFSKAPPPIRRLLDACLKKDSRKRLQAIGDMRLLLSGPEQQPPPSRSGFLWGGISGLAFAAGLALLAMQFWEMPSEQRALHLSLPVENAAHIGFVEISPDGQHLLVGKFQDGTPHLYLRPMNADVLQPVQGTSGARTPFWSPDSRSIGFFSDGSLKVVPAAGGPVQILCRDTGIGSGGTWSGDGVILFADAKRRLWRVSATGGPCTAVSQIDPNVQSRTPTFLPDGEQFIYVRTLLDDASAQGMYLASLREPAGRKLLSDFSAAIYTPPAGGRGRAHLVFLRKTTLMAQAFDDRAGQLIGDPFPIAGRATYSSGTPQVAASASRDGTLVYLAGKSRESQLTWFDRSGKVVGTVGPMLVQWIHGLARDGNAVAVEHFEESASSFWLHDLARGAATRLVPANSSVSGAVIWSPQNDRMWFQMRGPAGNGIFWKDLKSGRLEMAQASNPAQSMVLADGSPDGRFLLYTGATPRTQADLWYLPAESGKPAGPGVLISGTEAIESQGQLSPDGKWLAYYSTENGSAHIYVRPFPAGTEVWRVSSEAAREPRWSPDGRELFFIDSTTEASTLMASSIDADGQGGLRVGPPRRLFEFQMVTAFPQANIWSYSPHPDGKRFLVNAQPAAGAPTLNVILNWQRAAESAPQR